MSAIVVHQNESSNETLFESFSSFEADEVWSANLAGLFESESEFEASGLIEVNEYALFESESDAEFFGFLNNEPNITDNLLFESESEFIADFSNRRQLVGLFESFSEFEAKGEYRAAERGNLFLMVEILPGNGAGNYQRYDARLKVNGSIIPIEDYSEEKSASGAGKPVSVTLARLADKSLIAPGAQFVFEIDFGDGLGFVETSRGTLSSKNYSLSNQTGAPSDRFSFTTLDEANDKLTRSPETDLIIYDSSRAEVDLSEFEAIRDTAGNLYAPEAEAVYELSLYDLFQKIFVEKCGFTEYKTNLPDFPLRRADFSATGSYYDGVKPFVGEFEPIVFPDAAGAIWILDGTALLPAGFPAPRTITRVKSISVSAETDETIDSFELQFSESEIGDYYTVRTVSLPTEVRTRFGQLSSKTILETRIREYRSTAAPAQVLREITERETKTVYGQSQLDVVSIETENFEFDYLGRQKRSVKTVQKRVPDLDLGIETLQLLSEEELNYKYGVHPYSPGKQVLRRTELIETGKAAIDSENLYLGEDFAQRFLDAHRTGNLVEGMDVRSNVLLKTEIEEFKPIKNGQVKVFTTSIDHAPELVGKAAIVTGSLGEPRTGDAGLPSTGRAGRMLVFADDFAGRTPNTRIETFAVGELPLKHAIPLARRRLKRKTQKNARVSVEIIGWDKSLREGSLVRAVDRETNQVVQFIVEGWQRFARRAGAGMEFGTILNGVEI